MENTIKTLEIAIKEQEESIKSKEKEFEIYRELTNMTVELVETQDSEQIFECEIKNFECEERFVKFQLKINQENEVQYMPIEIKIDVCDNKVRYFVFSFVFIKFLTILINFDQFLNF